MRLTKFFFIFSWLCWHYPAQSQEFSHEFSVQEIPDSIWNTMQGKSYQPNPHIHRGDLRYLRVLHWDYDEKAHKGELVCHKLIAGKLLSIFRELYTHHYPIQQIGLPDRYDADDERQMRANNTSSFCYRSVSGTRRLSYHAQGLAIDINPLYNPYVRHKKDGTSVVRPANARKYADRTKQYRYKIENGDLCHRLFLKHGFVWGGSWRSVKDYQHFEYHPKSR